MLPQVAVLVSNVAERLAEGLTHLEIWKSADDGNSWTRILLQPLDTNTVIYRLNDTAANALSSRYRWRFSVNGVAPFSIYSKYVKAKLMNLDPAKLSVGFIRFSGVDGQPFKGKLLLSDETPEMVSGSVLYTQQALVLEAEDDGLAQIALMRGARLQVAIEGTTLVRSIVVPNTPTFDFLQTMNDAADLFTVQTTPPLATRRSL